MKKTVLIYSGIFIIVGLSFYIFLNESLANSNEGKVLSEENKEVHRILQDIKKELKPDYNIALISNGSNEIEVQVNGTQKYFNSIKVNIKNKVKKIVEETILKDHLITVTKWPSHLPHLSPEERERADKRSGELITLGQTLRNELQDYDEVGDIGGHIAHGNKTVTSITIETNLTGSDQEIHTKIKEIKGKVKELLNSPKLKSLSIMQTESYDLYVNNTDD